MREFRLWPCRSQRAALCVVALLGLGATSCGSEEDPLPSVDAKAPSRIEITGGIVAGASISGQTTLEAVAEDESGKVAKVAFFVSGLGICADEAPKNSGSTFSCAWDTRGTPKGDYQLIATAQDSAGNTSSSAPIPITVGVNPPPTISAASAGSSSINEGQSTTLSVTASDEGGEALSYSWAQVSPASPAGAFTDGTTAAAKWKAPLLSTTTTFTLRVTVTDPKGGTAQRTVEVEVVNVASANRAPTVDATITAPASVLAGDNAALTIGASDPDGDTLTYAWRTSPTANVGTFTSTSGNTTGWRSPDIAGDTNYTLQVTVSDGVASVTRSVSVKATVPRYAADIQSIWNAKCTSCHDNTSPSGGMNLLSGSSWTSLSVNGNNRCGTGVPIARAKAGQPDSSLLVFKITGKSGCGNRMPQNEMQYFIDNPGLVTRIRSWVLAGAKNN